MTSRSASPAGLILLGGDRTEADRTRARGIPTLLVTTPARARPGDYEQADRTLIVKGVPMGLQLFVISLSGVLMGIGILGIGLLVLAFGVVTVIFSYRLENNRLGKVYEELKAVVDGTATARRD